MSVVKKIKAFISDVVDNNFLTSTDLNVNERVAISAYYKAEERGFASGGYLDDWLAAEAEINASTTGH